MTNLWPPLWLSLQIATVATAATALLGVPLAYAMSRRNFPGKSLVEGLLMMPLVLPPTVVGYLLLMAFGASGWLNRWIGYKITFRFEGAVLAAMIVALPLLYMPAKSAFASVERELEDIAKLMGANRLESFWHVSIPLARRGLISGAILAFARALGEFGATVMVFGWQPGRLTLPISIYADYEQGNLAQATGAVIALSIISLTTILAYNFFIAPKE